MNMERLFNSPLADGNIRIDGLDNNVTVIVIFAPPQFSTPRSMFGWLKLFHCFCLSQAEVKKETKWEKF